MLQKCSLFKVLDVFFQEPTKEHYLLEIGRKVHLAHTSVKQHLTTLGKEGMVIKMLEKKENRMFPLYKSNRENSSFKQWKKVSNHQRILPLVENLRDHFMPKCIVLFGSYQRGEDTEESDIDFFLECKEGEIDLKKYEKQLQRKVQLHFQEHFKNYPKELKNNLVNGTVMHGYLEAFDS